MKIHYEKIGTHPALECYRNELPNLIAQYEAGRDGSGKQQSLDCMAQGALIEMCAAHFYGIDFMDFDSMAGVIDAIKSMEQELVVK